MKLIFLSLTLIIVNLYSSDASLRVQNKTLVNRQNQRIFLSGVNFPWYHYASDFGSGAYAQVKPKFEAAINLVAQNGGNAVRVWVHIDGGWSPKWDPNGFATGADTPSLINDLGQLLDHAEQQNVYVILCLWNLAVKPEKMMHLFTDDKKLDSYLEKVLKPIASALKDKPALAAYDIINEPAGSFAQAVADPEPCFDTMILRYTGTDWTHSHIHIKDMLRFVNRHSDAIKSVSQTLVTVGDGDQTMTTITPNSRNYYSDHCLQLAGGRPKGVLDFYQLHTYIWQGKFPEGSPFKHPAAAYHSDKPLLVGEFSTDCSESKDAVKNYEYLYDNDYAGALTWQEIENEGGNDSCSDKKATANAGMAAVAHLNTHGLVRVNI